MADLAVQITGFISGDDLEIRRTITGLTSSIAVAWLTVKRYPAQTDLEARLQKRITASDAPGTGQIVDPGGAGEDGDLRFDLTKADTGSLGNVRWVYDIQVKLAGGQVYTVEKGTIEFISDVTRATE